MENARPALQEQTIILKHLNARIYVAKMHTILKGGANVLKDITS